MVILKEIKDLSGKMDKLFSFLRNKNCMDLRDKL